MDTNQDAERRASHRRRIVRNSLLNVESLESRELLSQLHGLALYGGHPAPPAEHGSIHGRRENRPSGVVTKAPHFYEAYTGPKWAELNAVKASAKLNKNGNFVFTGTNLGRINKAPAVYVWGIDRSGNLAPGPFTNRPNIRFDAVVIVSLDSTLTPSARVVDLATGHATALSAGAASIHGRTVSVTVASSLLPSTGLSPSHYRFNYWPEDGGPPTSTSVASFAPEFHTVQVGSSH
jgi:hypothetical protein